MQEEGRLMKVCLLARGEWESDPGVCRLRGLTEREGLGDFWRRLVEAGRKKNLLEAQPSLLYPSAGTRGYPRVQSCRPPTHC